MNWTEVMNTFFATLPATITAIGGLIVIVRKLNEIHKTTNSLAQRAELAAGEVGRMQGHEAGMQAQRELHALDKQKETP